MNRAEKEERSRIMGEAPIKQLVWKMSIPLMVSMMVQALYNIVDSIFVAYISEDALTGISLVFPIQFLMIAIGTGTGVGFNAIISRCLGQKNKKAANDTANIAVFLGICNYIVFLCIGIFGAYPFLHMQIKDAQVVRYGVTYLQLVCMLSFGLFGQITMERLLQSTGNTFYNMMSQMTGAIFNIVFDTLLIFGLGPFPKLGVAGAALATVLGQMCGMILGYLFNIRYNKEIRFSVRQMRPQWKIMKEIYKIGIPSMVMVSLSSIMIFGLNHILIPFTKTAVTVYGIFYKLQNFVVMPIIGINNAIVPIVGYNFGAKKKERIREVYKCGCKNATVFTWIGFLVFELFPEELLSLFSASDALIRTGVTAFRIMGILFLVASIPMISSGFYQGLGKSMYSLLVSFIRQMLVLLPMAYLLSQIGDLNLVWWSLPIAEGAGVIAALILSKKIFGQLDKMMEALE